MNSSRMLFRKESLQFKETMFFLNCLLDHWRLEITATALTSLCSDLVYKLDHAFLLVLQHSDHPGKVLCKHILPMASPVCDSRSFGTPAIGQGASFNLSLGNLL